MLMAEKIGRYENNDCFYSIYLRKMLKVNVAKSKIMGCEGKDATVRDVEIQEEEMKKGQKVIYL